MDFTKPHIYRRQIVETGKYYIGKHNGSNSKYYKGSGVDYLEDYKKYVKNINTDLIEEILEYVDNISELNEREEHWLKLVDAVRNPLYYNRTNRARGWTIVTEKQRKQLSISHSGIKMSKESSLKKSKAMIGIPKHTDKSKSIIGDKNRHPKPKGFREKLQKPKTEQHKQNISKGKKGKSNPLTCKPILQYDLQGNFIKEWPSTKEASEQLGTANYWKACKDFTRSARGFRWKFKNK